jgi:serine/threonine protein kinase
MTQGLELRGAVLGKGYRLGRRVDDSDEHAYEATHERIPGRFVIRLFPAETLSQAEASSRLQRGARVSSLLRDVHAIQVLDCNASGEVPAFVVMERLPGRTLAAAMAEDGMLALHRVIAVVDSIAAALAAGHQIGLVHGDLRPAHVLLMTASATGGPTAKLSGFGWAKELRAAARVPAPSGYLAPEQQFGKVLTLDERVDQFGLAALAYEMIAGCLPFTEESADMTELVGARRMPPAIADLVPGVPKALDQVLRRALSFAPSQRFSSVTEFATQLRMAAATDSVPATAPIAAITVPNEPEAAIPSKPKNDVTEELDLNTLSTVQVADDDDDVDLDVPARDSEAEDVDDAKLVLGADSGPVLPDDAKTQIRRSPFFEEPKSSDDIETDDDIDIDDPFDNRNTSPPAGVRIPAPLPRGVPLGRPLKVPRGSGEFGLAPIVAAAPPEGEITAEHATAGKLALLWAAAKQRRAWTFPVVSGVALLFLVGAMVVVVSRRPSNDAAETQQPKHAAAAPTPVVAAPSQAAPAIPPAPGAPAAEAPAPGAPAVAHVQQVPPAAPEAAPSSAMPSTIDPPPPAPPVTNRPAVAKSVVRRPGVKLVAPVAPTKPPAVPSPGGGPDDCSIQITSKPWAQVWIDGKNTGRKTPLDNLKVACGMRKLELKRPDRDIEQMEMLKVVPGAPYRGSYELE